MDPTRLTKDFSEFLRCLNAHHVEYLVIGGHAVAFHGYPRATADLDVWMALSPQGPDRPRPASVAPSPGGIGGTLVFGMRTAIMRRNRYF